jgi:hypothetical protein
MNVVAYSTLPGAAKDQTSLRRGAKMTQGPIGHSPVSNDPADHDLSYVEGMSRRYAGPTNVILIVSLALFIGCIAIALVALFIVGWLPIGVVGTRAIP